MVNFIYKCINQHCPRKDIEISVNSSGLIFCPQCGQALVYVRTIDTNTVAGSAIGGAIIGGLIGGPEGALIGSIIGAWLGSQQEKNKKW